MSVALVSGQRVLRDRYELIELVASEDASAGLPMLWRVADSGSICFAKIWRDDPAFPELKSIWTHEIRNLLRLGGLPFAEEVFVRLREVGVDPVGFVVVLDGEGREPLSGILANRSRYAWLSDVRSVARRRALWEGILRVARGLAMMHGEGTLHRMLRAESVFTDIDGTCDFRLSGFEWSLRVSAAGARKSPIAATIEAPELSEPAAQFSVASDWFTFGILLIEVFLGAGTPSEPEQKNPLRALRTRVDRSNLTPGERKFIADLIDPDPEKRTWHASDITSTIDEIIESLSTERNAVAKPVFVGFDLSRESDLSKLIVQNASDSISIRDTDAQLSFIKDDLGSEPQVSTRLRPFPHYVLHGTHINYQLRKWPTGQPWDAAFCTRHDVFPAIEPVQVYRFPGRRIEVRTSAWIAENLRSVKSFGDQWSVAFPIRTGRRSLTDEQVRTLQFFQVTNQLEALLTITQIWPVRIVNSTISKDHLIVEVTPISDEPREKLARLLGVPTPPEQMLRLFQLDEVVGRRAAEQNFVFNEEGRLFRKETTKIVNWRFVEFRHHAAGPRYRFSHHDSSETPPRGNVYLRPSDLAGSSIQLHRRKKAIDDLAAHRMLLDAIDDPGSVKRTTIDELAESEAIANLDPSKKLALSEIWRSQPFYALQGPPGTGKTTLVATMAAEQVATSPSTQILITGQSHSTVDTVMQEVLGALGQGPPTLAVRLDSDEIHGTRQTASRLATALVNSEFGRRSTDGIKTRLRALSTDHGVKGAAERSGFESLVEEGAGIIFATSNSGDLSRLIETGRRYDWSIIEEAGRAHGFDLAQSLQASHRILLIGDQQQLPAFNLDVLDALLREPTRVLEALKKGIRYAPTLIERFFVKNSAADLERFKANCAAWRTLLPFFGQLFRVCDKAGKLDGDPIARQLTHQHRMHPDIQQLVSECFYPDLKTADEALQRFAQEEDGFEIVPAGWMPQHRIVFIDVPWIQSGRFARGEDIRPRYSSAVEAEVLIDALAQFRRSNCSGLAVSKNPSLQVLSPYRAQVRRVSRLCHGARADDKLPNLDSFEIPGGNGELGGTVDEFQGNQADVILVSLVRNNHAKRGKGLGFLADGRRWNVLLSRAKRKLVLVGSWEFLCSRFSAHRTLPDDDPMAELAKVVRALSRAFERGTAVRLPLHEIPNRSPDRRRGARSHRRRNRRRTA